MGGDVGRRVDGMLTDRVPWDPTRPMESVQAAASKDKPLLERAFQGRDYAKVVDIALGWPLYFAKKFNATVPTWCACFRGQSHRCSRSAAATAGTGTVAGHNPVWRGPERLLPHRLALGATGTRAHRLHRPCPALWPGPSPRPGLCHGMADAAFFSGPRCSW